MTILGYARVSTDDQSLDIQREQLRAAGCKRIFEEKASGKSADVRAELQALLKFAEPGDTIVVTKLDRLARSTLDMLRLITGLAKRGITFKSLAEPWASTDNPAAELMLTSCPVSRSSSAGAFVSGRSTELPKPRRPASTVEESARSMSRKSAG